MVLRVWGGVWLGWMTPSSWTVCIILIGVVIERNGLKEDVLLEHERKIREL